MNRKLQHTMTALSATATVFTVLLLAGGPPVAPAQPAALMILSTGVADSDQPAPVDGTDEAAADSAHGGRSSHLRRTRAALALPYFSFAQGLRRFGS